MEQLQQEVRAFCARHRLDAPLAHRVLDAMSELGEVAKEVLRMTDYGRRPPEQREEIKGELGDMLFSLIALANIVEVDLEDALRGALKKYEARMQRGGSAGSESEGD